MRGLCRHAGFAHRRIAALQRAGEQVAAVHCALYVPRIDAVADGVDLVAGCREGVGELGVRHQVGQVDHAVAGDGLVDPVLGREGGPVADALLTVAPFQIFVPLARMCGTM